MENSTMCNNDHLKVQSEDHDRDDEELFLSVLSRHKGVFNELSEEEEEWVRNRIAVI